MNDATPARMITRGVRRPIAGRIEAYDSARQTCMPSGTALPAQTKAWLENFFVYLMSTYSTSMKTATNGFTVRRSM